MASSMNGRFHVPRYVVITRRTEHRTYKTKQGVKELTKRKIKETAHRVGGGSSCRETLVAAVTFVDLR